tara:strand:+ start:884 stop:2215 length:1332 start_codon:yes stop_codon:yes gene_type:complete
MKLKTKRKKNKGLNLYKEAKKIILGGNMLFSKKPEVWLPKYWPTYFSKAINTSVWDLDKKKYVDMICAVGQSTLGYTNRKIEKAIINNIKKSNMTTLNCPEEVELSKKLLSIHSWAKKVKYARSGGEANAMAIRIARSASKKEHVAICGYHGWHDWYLSANLKDNKKLNQHLLEGLNPVGVPKALKNTVHPFRYNHFEDLKKIVKKYDIGTIKMEVASRGKLPERNFLKKVQSFARKNKIILIFDECTSGFRRNFGGLHLALKLKPDIVMYGKALGNGFAITAVLGNKKVMAAAEQSFISSTFWTERMGYVAAINTLNEMKRIKSWNILIKNGKYINQCWKKLAKKHNLNIKIEGIESITSFRFMSKYNLEYKTFIAQEMLKKGYLASNLIYINIHHNKKLIDNYIKKLDPVFEKIKFLEKNGNVNRYLKGPKCQSTFNRLNN